MPGVTYRCIAAVSSTGKQRLALMSAVPAAVLLGACASSTHAGTSSASAAGATAAPVIRCNEVIGTQRSGTEAGYRVVLGIISAPPARLRQVVPTKSRPWSFWRKAGLVLHSTHKTVSVIVPNAWRSRVAIVWGNARPPVSAVKFEPCPNGRRWNAYAGGFFLRKQRGCVPLTFRVGKRSETVRFGLGIACSGG